MDGRTRQVWEAAPRWVRVTPRGAIDGTRGHSDLRGCLFSFLR